MADSLGELSLPTFSVIFTVVSDMRAYHNLTVWSKVCINQGFHGCRKPLSLTQLFCLGPTFSIDIYPWDLQNKHFTFPEIDVGAMLINFKLGSLAF